MSLRSRSRSSPSDTDLLRPAGALEDLIQRRDHHATEQCDPAQRSGTCLKAMARDALRKHKDPHHDAYDDKHDEPEPKTSENAEAHDRDRLSDTLFDPGPEREALA